MRKNTQDVFRAYVVGQSKGRWGDSIWTDGKRVFSYWTCLLARNSSGTVLNRTRYSVTTTQHQTGLAYLISGWSDVRYVENLGLGASAVDLVARSRVDWRMPGEHDYPRAECSWSDCDTVRDTGTSRCREHERIALAIMDELDDEMEFGGDI